MGVYLALSALDFPFCFAAVRWLGPERVGKAEEAVVDGIGKRIPEPVKEAWAALKGKVVGWRASIAGVTQGDPGKDGEVEGFDGGIVHAEARSKGANASEFSLFFPERTKMGIRLLGRLGFENRRRGILTSARHLDAAGPRLRDPQELHLHPAADHGGHLAQGCQDAQGLGMADRQAESQGSSPEHVSELPAYSGLGVW